MLHVQSAVVNCIGLITEDIFFLKAKVRTHLHVQCELKREL